jgi:hypothetical protein
VNGVCIESQPALRPLLTTSVCTPYRSSALPTAILPPTTPIDPVSVPGAATILSAATAT